MKSNKQYYEDLEKSGSLESVQKDGKPKTSLEKTIALGYPIIVAILTIITSFLLIFKRKKMDFKVFIPHMIIGSICGWFWGIFMEKLDSNYPGWLFHPWAVIGPEWILTIEDWLFYPVCGAFFYTLFRLIKNTKKSNELSKWCFQIFHISITLFFIYFTSYAGKSIALQFAIISIPLFFYSWDRWDTLHYLKMFLFIIIFATLWDWAAVTWITKIPGFSWASQWIYVTFDSQGIAHHSSVFLSYKEHPWAWIFNNPIEITPWFGIAGAMFTYSLAMALDKFIYKKND
ncbi:MAG: hypothetical protein PHF86_03205 [Candidatus Nanoarchaeia archaeon]|jgi:hypothetical protein|nr:hypothetical protein [Candidatus Nanoarchaeia archaeon]